MRERRDSPYDSFDIPTYILTSPIDVALREALKISYDSMSTLSAAFGSHVRVPVELKDLSILCGRPLWANYNREFDKAFEVASYKLTCNNENLTELTCIIMRTGSSVQPQDKLAHKLVLSGMATLLYVDSDSSRCWIDFIPEPMVSNGARTIMTSFRSLSKSINEYVRRLELGTFHGSGDAGEIVARIILLRNMDLCLVKRKISSHLPEEALMKDLLNIGHDDFFGIGTSEESKREFICELDRISSLQGIPAAPIETPESLLSTEFFFPKVSVTSVKEYLMMLSKRPVSEFSNFGVSENVLNGLVSVNQFIQMDNPLTKITAPYLLHTFARSCALILPPRAPDWIY